MSTDVTDEVAAGARSTSGEPEDRRERLRQRYVIVLLSAVIGLAMVLRISLFRYQTTDYLYYYRQWYEFVVEHGRFAALRYEFSDQNAPYRYVMVLVTLLPGSPLTGIKAVSVCFELLIAFFAYRITALRFGLRSWVSGVAALIVFLLPTVVLNGSMWAQGDAIYASFALGGVYFLLRRMPYWACVFFGLALAFKLQAIFILPLLLIMVLLGRVPWRAVLAIPAVYLLLDVPALLLGADPGKLLTIYVRQTDIWPKLTMNAPSIWQFFRGNEGMDSMRAPAVLFAGLLVLVLCLLVLLSRAEPTDTRILLLGTVSVMLVPFVLPSMHERYFYLADLLTVLLAFHLPRRLWFVPVVVQFVSLLSYLPFLFRAGDGGEPVDFRILAALELAMLVVLARETVRQLRPGFTTTDLSG
ncbi:hypothetical protein [Amycolatopsis sp. NPDC059021]|uniref:hypothetical protein n=1 Tax=Amycolatopsis sp. NPDC059021 TaxID=3346704 RepID=UPI00366F4D77